MVEDLVVVLYAVDVGHSGGHDIEVVVVKTEDDDEAEELDDVELRP